MHWPLALSNLTSPQTVVSRYLTSVINISHGCLKNKQFSLLTDLPICSQKTMASLLDSQVMLPIFKKLDLKSLISCTVTCKTWYNNLALEDFFHIEVIIHLVDRFNGDITEWRSFLKRSKAVCRIKVNRAMILKII
jgi:hypothetical protein